MKAKNLLLTLAVGAMAISCNNSGSMTQTSASLKTTADSASFYIGYMYGSGLQQIAKKSGVDTLANGIQYKIIKKGEGAKPAATDMVKVHYRGTLIDGTEFDSSIKRGEPVEFPLNRVIPGWTTALQQMPVGSKWEIFIPSDQAYGPRGNGSIGPNETLIFEVELLDIVTPDAKEADQK